MKYLKTYKIFESEIDQHTLIDGQSRLNDYIKSISEYNSKKSQLEKLILNNKENKDIDSNIDKLVNNNKLLSMYLPIINIKKHIIDLEDKIKYDNDSINSRQSDIGNAGKLADINDRNTQIKNINTQISDIKKRSTDNNKKLSELKSQLLKEESELKKKIEIGKKDIEEEVKKLQK